MRKILFLLMILPAIVKGQGYVQFGALKTTDSSRSHHLVVTGGLRFLYYAKTDTTQVLTFDAAGKPIFVTKGAMASDVILNQTAKQAKRFYNERAASDTLEVNVPTYSPALDLKYLLTNDPTRGGRLSFIFYRPSFPRWEYKAFLGSGGTFVSLGVRGFPSVPTANHSAGFLAGDRTITDYASNYGWYSTGGLMYWAFNRDTAWNFTDAFSKPLISVDSNGAMTFLQRPASYASNFGALFTVRSLIDKGYADSLYGVVQTQLAGKGTVSSVGLTSTTLTITGSPITTTGSFTANLPSVVSAGSYTKPTVDIYGRVTGGSSLAVSDITSLQSLMDAKLAIDTTYVVVSPVAGVLTFDCANKQFRNFYVTLNANVTSIVFNNTVSAGEYTIFIIQDATGGRTYTGWPSNVRWGSRGAPAPTVTSNGTTDVFNFKKGPLGNFYFNYELNWN